MPKINFAVKEPRLSEKFAFLSPLGKYIFRVAEGVNGRLIKKEIEDYYKVKVAGVNFINIRNKRHRVRKAVVTLKPGEKINIEP